MMKLNSLVKKQGEALKEEEYNSFLLNELVEANLKSESSRFLKMILKRNNVESRSIINRWQ
jgi:DNA repair protein RecN (Recombination protein N)